MGLWAELWSRPGDPNFGRVHDYIPCTFGFNDGVNRVGGGTCQIAETFGGFDDILTIDRTTPSNSKRGLFRIFSENDPTTPIFEWRPTSLIPKAEKDDPNVDVAGEGVKAFLNDARTEPYDWDGSDDFVSRFPDWIWGGQNILSKPGFEEPNAQPIIYELLITATGGTYTLSDGTDTTSAIAFDANESTIETRLEADIAAITDVNVEPIDGGFTIEFVDPPTGITLTVNTGSLTGGTAILTLTQEGILLPTPWMKSQQISIGTPKVFGCYDTFEVSDEQAHSGTYSLKIDPCNITSNAERYTGVQQVLNVQAGGTYQASIWIRPTSGTDTYRFVIRKTNGELIFTTAEQSFTANVWTQVTISDLVLDDGTDQIIFRFANVDDVGVNPGVFYLDDAELTPGLAATTIGDILNALYDHATDSTLRSPIVWDDGSGTNTPYLTPDFTDALDSNGVAWDVSDHKLRVTMRMDLGLVMAQAARDWEYEWRIVPDDVEAGTWLWQVYNPGGMKTDYTTAASPAIQGGAEDVRRSIRKFFPTGTDMLVEGLGRVTSRERDATLVTALGRVEASRLDRELPVLSAIQAAADSDEANIITTSLDYTYILVDPDEEPLSAFTLGDVLNVHDPPDVDDTGRFLDVTVTVDEDKTEWECHFLPPEVEESS